MKISELQDTTLLLLIGQCSEMMAASLIKSKELFGFWNDLYNDASAEERRRILAKEGERND